MSLIRFHTPTLSAWPSFDRVDTLRNELDRLFDFSLPTNPNALFSGWSPVLDVHDSANEFVVTVELPGMKKDEIGITLHDGVLSISGERKLEREKKDGETFRSERSFGKFQRNVTLPAAVDGTKVSATYKDGILTVTLPKAEEAKPKQIAVSVS